MERKDLIGSFIIPDHLLRQAQSQAAAEPSKDTDPEIDISSGAWLSDRKSFSAQWRAVRTITGSTGHIHRVDVRLSPSGGNFLEYRCTCQSFRIQKKGYCKHTLQTSREIEKK